MSKPLQVVCPYLSTPWCLQDMLESFGESDVPVLIVDNSPNSEAKNIPGTDAPNVEIVERPKNIGSSAAWNIGLNKGADQTLIISQWVRFSPMEHSRRPASWGLNHIAKGIKEKASPYGLTFGDQGYHLISIGRKTVEAIGLFDENYRCYGNDDDYVHRMDLADIKKHFPDWGDWRDSGAYSVAFGAQKRGGYDGNLNFKANENYYDRKWTSVPGQYPGDYKHPFNDPTKGLDYWPEVPELKDE